ncbi:MAG TPA: adenylate/guanylate cyclase domain-containing protein, partial [Candidatus Wallbacteria bacterium]|nr:adenylate/guanylate cyclase domain-containing protein [Candidatus Wallbacteria bacterium]
MDKIRSYSDDKFSKLLEKEVNLTLEKGAFFAALLGLSSSFIIFLLEYAGYSHDFMIPGLWSFLCGLYAALLYFIARKGNLNQSNQYPIILVFVSLPSVIYILAYFGLPSKTATYITGPPSYIYIFLVVMTGFLFNRNISIFSGFVAGIEYFIIYLMARPYLANLNCGDNIMLQDMTGVPMYFFKSMVMVFSGIVVGILSDTAKRLISKALEEEHEKQNIDRLFGQYVSEEIKDRIIAEKMGVTGEIKSAAILFSDIRSFTSISESLAPDKVVEQLNEHLDKMVACINLEGGVIDKFIGDAVMATFGGVMRVDNPCEAAV